MRLNQLFFSEMIEIKKLTDLEFEQMDLQNWPIWEKEVSSFDWFYDEKEQFYVLEGDIRIKTLDSEYHIVPGDFVTCHKGLNCRWEVSKFVKKHYHFSEE